MSRSEMSRMKSGAWPSTMVVSARSARPSHVVTTGRARSPRLDCSRESPSTLRRVAPISMVVDVDSSKRMPATCSEPTWCIHQSVSPTTPNHPWGTSVASMSSVILGSSDATGRGGDGVQEVAGVKHDVRVERPDLGEGVLFVVSNRVGLDVGDVEDAQRRGRLRRGELEVVNDEAVRLDVRGIDPSREAQDGGDCVEDREAPDPRGQRPPRGQAADEQGARHEDHRQGDGVGVVGDLDEEKARRERRPEHEGRVHRHKQRQRSERSHPSPSSHGRPTLGPGGLFRKNTSTSRQAGSSLNPLANNGRWPADDG